MCNCNGSPRFPFNDLDEQLTESQARCDVDFYAMREVRKLARLTSGSIKSDCFDDGHQTGVEKDANIVFLEKDINTTGDSEYWKMTNEKFSLGIDLTRQSSKRTKN